MAFFFKQWGAWGEDGIKRNKKANGRILNGREWNDFPVNVVAATKQALSNESKQ